MFKWPGFPSPRAGAHEVADFAELSVWGENGISTTALEQALGRLADDDYSGGVPVDDPEALVVDETYLEVERRMESCRGGYPFDIDDLGYRLFVDHSSHNQQYDIYRFLLLATRLNMNENRVHDGIDGANLFERVSADVGRHYLGERAQSYVFGVGSAAGTFPAKIESLCTDLGEGEGFRNAASGVRVGDGKLDVVVWKGFADGRPGKMIGFGQCKTGTSYRDTLSQLQPDKFCTKWFRTQPALTPIRMFFVAEALPDLGWYESAVDSGLLFDRCRMVDFADGVAEETLADVRCWTSAAAESVALGVEQ